jgi:urocanate hydratase
MEKFSDMDKLIERVKSARKEAKPLSIAYHGNVVDLWERLVQEKDLPVELGSDQTSLHNPFNGGYYPVQLSFEEANTMMVQDPPKFKTLVEESLRRHVAAINIMTQRGLKFWDYGNSFLLEASRAKADVTNSDGTFKYPSYVEHIMGDIFSLGFGPFRWVCTSGDSEDLDKTDEIAGGLTLQYSQQSDLSQELRMQYADNHLWISQAKGHEMVVGSQARILYSDAYGRAAIAVAFNNAVRDGVLKAPVVISRDHHDVSGTDSPWRETSNVTDGSKFCADMAVHNFAGDSFRGATWVALHNGGGTGWGEAINGGFGLVLDGSPEAEQRARLMLSWDVNNGIARRCWGRNANAEATIKRAMEADPNLRVTLPYHTNDDLLRQALVHK